MGSPGLIGGAERIRCCIDGGASEEGALKAAAKDPGGDR